MTWLALALCSPALADDPGLLFHDDFESGLGRWTISDPAAIGVIDSGDPDRGMVLRLRPAHSRLHALIRGSEGWGPYRLEGRVLFPTDEHNYLGLIYNYREVDGRVDLGSIYIKGNGSYIRVIPAVTGTRPAGCTRSSRPRSPATTRS